MVGHERADREHYHSITGSRLHRGVVHPGVQLSGRGPQPDLRQDRVPDTTAIGWMHGPHQPTGERTLGQRHSNQGQLSAQIQGALPEETLEFKTKRQRKLKD